MVGRSVCVLHTMYHSRQWCTLAPLKRMRMSGSDRCCRVRRLLLQRPSCCWASNEKQQLLYNCWNP